MNIFIRFIIFAAKPLVNLRFTMYDWGILLFITAILELSFTLSVLRAWAQRVEIIALLIYDAGLQPTKQQREAISMARQEVGSGYSAHLHRSIEPRTHPMLHLAYYH